MKNTKFRSTHEQGPFHPRTRPVFCLYRISLTSPVMIVIGLLGYWHILPVYFAITLPMMSRPSVGYRSPRLHFCREPISHLASVGGNHPCISVAAQPVFLWTNHARYVIISQPEYYPFSRRPIGADLCINALTSFVLRLANFG